jgi:lipopolysaccharide export system permease protein
MSALKPGIFSGFHGLVLFAEQVIPLKNEMKRIFIYDERDEKHPLAITAQVGILRNLPQQDNLTLRLSEGTIHVDQKKESRILQKIDFDVYDINLEIAHRSDLWRDYSPPSYNYPQLKQRLAETVHDVPLNRQLQVELHRRFSLSFACVVFAGLGFFIGVLSQRGVRSTAIIICLVVGLLYWLSYISSNALAISGWIWPWLGIWIPNLLFGLLAYLCYYRAAYRG